MSNSARSIAGRWLGQARWGLALTVLGVILLLVIGAETGLFGTTTLAKVQDVGFSKAFVPNIIGPGSTTTLSFSINNDDPVPLTNLAFTDVLPVGVRIATPANALATCDSVLVAPDGGDTISFSAERLGPNSACIVTVNVTSSEIGIHQNASGQLTSDAGEHGNALADLTVDAGRPGFSKSFSPSTMPPGGTSTLTFLIDNTSNDANLYSLSFLDVLPVGMVISEISNTFTDCDSDVVHPIIIAVPGTSSISFSYNDIYQTNPAVTSGSSCIVSVDVTTISPGVFANISGELLASYQSCGFASAVLDAPLKFLIKSFSDDPVPPGGDVTLEFTVTNLDRANAATGITFSDDLDATLAGLEATGLPLADPCGAGSQLAGTSTLTLSDGELPPEASCTFSVTLKVPIAASPGVYVNTTSAITAQVGGDVAVYDPAIDHLFVWPAPLLTKTFDDPVAAGDTVTLTFTISNTSPFSSVTDIAFTDEHTTIFPYGTSVGLPSPGFCGASSAMSIIALGANEQALSMAGGSLEPGASCTFDVTFQSPAGMPGGVYYNTTSPVAALVGDMPVVGRAATDDLEVVAAPTLRKSFHDPVIPGESVALEFSISHDAFAPADATGIAFTDNLATVMTGLTATGLPASGVCGAGSQISGTTNLSFTGGSLAPGETCAFSVTLQVTDTAVSGIYPNVTSNVMASVAGLTTTGNLAQDNLDIGGLVLSKSFTDDPAIPGGTVTLEFTLVNSSTVHTATNVLFIDDLNGVVSGLAATDLPKTDVCGAGSQLSGPSFLIFQNGSLDPGTSCTFSTTLQVPPGTASNTYGNTTGSFQATIAGGTVALVNAADELVVSSDMLLFEKSFAGDPVMPGDALTLTFTLTNLHATQGVTGIAFDDDLDAVLPGLAAVGLPADDVCGAGSRISGTSQLDFTGGTLDPGASCAFDVVLQVPQDAAPGTYRNATGEATGDVGGLAVRGDPARDDFLVSALTFSKSFDRPSVAGGNPTLSFDIHNPSTDTQAVGISFLDDLEAVLPGLTTTGLPASDVCGPGSLLTGLSFLTLSGGSLEPEASCTFSVTLQVPETASPGDYVNTTDDLTLNGLPVSDPAVATLSIEPPPDFSKNFAPDAMLAGEISTLTFTIGNSASALAASDLDFADTLPAGVVVADPPNASTTCIGGSLTAVAGADSISYSGGTVAAGASCTVQVDVTSSAGGAHVNTTGDLTSSSGNSGPASDTLFIGPVADLSLLKSDSADPVETGTVLTYTLVVSNDGPSEASVVVTDDLPAAFIPSANTCGASGDPLVWDVGALAAGGADTCAISGLVDAGFSGLLTNTATVASDIPDPRPENNIVTETTQVYQLASIGDYAWEDANMNGLQDAGESGMPGITVNLRDGANTAQLDSTTTSASGLYSFTGLVPGDYLLEFVLPPDYIFSFPDQGADDVDSDPNVISGQTTSTTLDSGEYDPTWDAGMVNVTPAVLGDYVWNDDDGDGVQDAGEAGINGVTVNLWYDSDADDAPDSILATTTTTNTGGQDGLYEFASLPPSRTYQLEFVAPPGYVFSPPDQGADDADSDADPLTGLTPTFIPAPDENIPTLDAGMYLPALSVAKSVSQTAFMTDRVVITYSITITNTGTVLLSPVMVTDTLDDGLTFILANPPGSVLLPGQAISWDDVTGGAGLAPAAAVQIVLQAVAYDQGPYDNVVEVTGVYPSGTVSATDQVAVRGPTLVYLPLLMHNYRPPTIAPDLVVDAIVATSDDVQVTISNQGNAPVLATGEFYVQVYIDPDPAPAAVNEMWYNLGDQGLFWGITADLLPLAPGVTLTLTYKDAYYWPSYSRFYETLEPGTPVYAQVDTWGDVGDHGAVLENHEILGQAYNNVLGPVYSTAKVRHDGATVPAERSRPSSWHRR